MLNKVKMKLSSEFEMKDMGEASYVPRIEIKRHRGSRTLSLSQERYLHMILKRFGMDNCKLASTPLVIGKRLSKDQCPRKRQEPLNVLYAQAMGSLMYAMTCIRPDLFLSSKHD